MCFLDERVFINTEGDFPYLTVHLRHEFSRRTGPCLFENRRTRVRRHGGRVGRRQGHLGKGPTEERRRGRPGWVLTPPWHGRHAGVPLDPRSHRLRPPPRGLLEGRQDLWFKRPDLRQCHAVTAPATDGELDIRLAIKERNRRGFRTPQPLHPL